MTEIILADQSHPFFKDLDVSVKTEKFEYEWDYWKTDYVVKQTLSANNRSLYSPTFTKHLFMGKPLQRYRECNIIIEFIADNSNKSGRSTVKMRIENQEIHLGIPKKTTLSYCGASLEDLELEEFKQYFKLGWFRITITKWEKKNGGLEEEIIKETHKRGISHLALFRKAQQLKNMRKTLYKQE